MKEEEQYIFKDGVEYRGVRELLKTEKLRILKSVKYFHAPGISLSEAVASKALDYWYLRENNIYGLDKSNLGLALIPEIEGLSNVQDIIDEVSKSKPVRRYAARLSYVRKKEKPPYGKPHKVLRPGEDYKLKGDGKKPAQAKYTNEAYMQVFFDKHIEEIVKYSKDIDWSCKGYAYEQVKDFIMNIIKLESERGF
jgi:hypothetical protein